LDISFLIRQRLIELGLGQRELAAASQVTESYISQLLTRKKAPPASGRTDIYERIGNFLKLPPGELGRLADLQRKEELKKKVAEPPSPLFRDCRELVLRTCEADTRAEVRRIFEKEPFGELERLVTQKVLEVAQRIARGQLRNEDKIRVMAELSGRTYEQMRVAMLEFLDTDIFNVSLEGCVGFLDPVIDGWSINLKTFSLEIVIKEGCGKKRFEFQEVLLPIPQPGFDQFLQDKSLSADATSEEIQILKALAFPGRKPTALYYYRELQSLRDPLHFSPSA
jgi:transcriptional regulator with XRE-family HTH domain